MKIQAHALLIAVASVLGTAAHAQSNVAQSWGAYRSIVNPSYTDSHDRTTSVETTVDASRRAVGSFNQDNDVDASRRTIGSYNTALDSQVAKTDVNAAQAVRVVDAQTANTVGTLGGHTQVGRQGDLVLNMSAGQPAYAQGGFYKSPAETSASYDVNAKNDMFTGGDNNGLMRNQNNINIGGAQISDSRIGNDQMFYAGDQALVQDVRQGKESATQTSTSSSIGTTVSK
jgi:hypothetical protein